MLIRIRSLRHVLAPYLAALVVTVGVVVPLLDTGRAVHGPVVESEHQPGTCMVGVHDHTICTQVGANHALATEGLTLAPPLTPVEFSVLPATDLTLRFLSTWHDSRAPPRTRSS